MRMEVGNLPPGSVVLSEKCPYSPFTRTPLLQSHAFALAALLPVSGQHTGPAAIIRTAEAGYRISADRARHKRGPPPAFIL